MEEDRETPAQDQGYRLHHQNTPGSLRPLFPKRSVNATSSSYERLPAGLVKVDFVRGEMTGRACVVRDDIAADLIRRGIATKSESQVRIRQT